MQGKCCSETLKTHFNLMSLNEMICNFQYFIHVADMSSHRHKTRQYRLNSITRDKILKQELVIFLNVLKWATNCDLF